MRQYINDLSFNTYISPMCEDWCKAHPHPFPFNFSASFLCFCSPHVPPPWEASCWHSLQGVLLIFLERHCRGSRRERERERNESHTIAADTLPSSTTTVKITSHPAGMCHYSFVGFTNRIFPALDLYYSPAHRKAICQSYRFSVKLLGYFHVEGYA